MLRYISNPLPQNKTRGVLTAEPYHNEVIKQLNHNFISATQRDMASHIFYDPL